MIPPVYDANQDPIYYDNQHIVTFQFVKPDISLNHDEALNNFAKTERILKDIKQMNAEMQKLLGSDNKELKTEKRIIEIIYILNEYDNEIEELQQMTIWGLDHPLGRIFPGGPKFSDSTQNGYQYHLQFTRNKLNEIRQISQNIKSIFATIIEQKVKQEIENFLGNTDSLQDLYKTITRLSVRQFNSEDLKIKYQVLLGKYQKLLDSLSAKLKKVEGEEREKLKKIDSEVNELLKWVMIFPEVYSDLRIEEIKNEIQKIRDVKKRKIIPTERGWMTWISKQNIGKLSILPPDLTRKILSYLDGQKQLRCVNRSFKLIYKNHSWQLWQPGFNYWEVLSGEPLRKIFNFLSAAELNTLCLVSNLFKNLIIRTGNRSIMMPQSDYDIENLISVINTGKLKGDISFSIPMKGCSAAIEISDGLVFIGLENGLIEIYDLHTKRFIDSIDTGERVRHLKVVKGKLFSVSNYLTIKIWDIKTRELLTTLKNNDTKRTCMNFSLEILEEEGMLFLGLYWILGAIRTDTEIQVWNLKENKLEYVLSTPNHLMDLKVKGLHLFSGSADRSIYIWNWKTGEKIISGKGRDLSKGFLDALTVDEAGRIYSIEYKNHAMRKRGRRTITIGDSNTLKQIDALVSPMRNQEYRKCLYMKCIEEKYLVVIEAETSRSRDFSRAPEFFITIFDLDGKIIASFTDSSLYESNIVKVVKIDNNIMYLAIANDREKSIKIKKFDLSPK